MTSEEVLTCAINIGEQLLVSGAEISRVEDTIRRICNAYGIRQSHIFSIASCIIVTLETKEGSDKAGGEGAELDHADAKNFKLRDGYVEAGPAE